MRRGGPCIVDGCTRIREHKATGYCRFHQRRHLSGVPFNAPHKAKPDRECIRIRSAHGWRDVDKYERENPR